MHLDLLLLLTCVNITGLFDETFDSGETIGSQLICFQLICFWPLEDNLEI